jgi:hypothetical protein
MTTYFAPNTIWLQGFETFHLSAGNLIFNIVCIGGSPSQANGCTRGVVRTHGQRLCRHGSNTFSPVHIYASCGPEWLYRCPHHGMLRPPKRMTMVWFHSFRSIALFACSLLSEFDAQSLNAEWVSASFADAAYVRPKLQRTPPGSTPDINSARPRDQFPVPSRTAGVSSRCPADAAQDRPAEGSGAQSPSFKRQLAAPRGRTPRSFTRMVLPTFIASSRADYHRFLPFGPSLAAATYYAR